MIRRGNCVHYNGRREETCEAGVNYKATFGTELNACRAPCIQEYATHERVGEKLIKVWKPWDRKGRPVIECSLRQMPTQEEVAVADVEFEKHFQQTLLALKVSHEWKTWTKTNRVAKAEVVECPVCKGKLHLSQSAYNGHIWGKCETEKCVSWME